MSRRSSAAALALGLLGGLGACQCRRPGEEPAKPAAPSAPEAHPSRGVKVPLADGWAARLGTEQSLSFGPPGRAVLRIDLRPGAAASKPDSTELAEMFINGFDGGTEMITVKAGDRDGYSWAWFRLVLAPPSGARDAGATGEPALLGAKVVDNDLFLCATLPGASEAEVESAAHACEGISYSALP